MNIIITINIDRESADFLESKKIDPKFNVSYYIRDLIHKEMNVKKGSKTKKEIDPNQLNAFGETIDLGDKDGA